MRLSLSGALVLVTAAADTGYTGASAGTFQSVRLAEVTVEGSTSVPVAGGRCLWLSGGLDSTTP